MLSDIKVKSARGKNKPYKITDGQGLYMIITPTGGKWWRFKYRIGGKEKLLSLGTYPEISLADAREKRDAARRQVANGINPGEVRKAEKKATLAVTEGSFEVVAREWHEKFKKAWTKIHADTTIRRLERDVFPWLATRPISEIKAPELLAVLRRIESRGAQETAHRVRTICGQVFRYAVATGLFITDSKNHTIRRIVISTGEVTTLAGTAFSGSADGTGTAASFTDPPKASPRMERTFMLRINQVPSEKLSFHQV